MNEDLRIAKAKDDIIAWIRESEFFADTWGIVDLATTPVEKTAFSCAFEQLLKENKIALSELRGVVEVEGE